jgi:hypothetical protein
MNSRRAGKHGMVVTHGVAPAWLRNIVFIIELIVGEL